jgi:hypothetical protein
MLDGQTTKDTNHTKGSPSQPQLAGLAFPPFRVLCVFCGSRPRPSFQLRQLLVLQPLADLLAEGGPLLGGPIGLWLDVQVQHSR